MSDFIVVAEARADAGKGASRRLRRLEGKMPAVIYGANKPAQSLTLIRKDFEHMLENEACFSSILEVQVGGESESAIIKDIQRHPAKGFPMHADFLRVRMDQAIKVNVPPSYRARPLRTSKIRSSTNWSLQTRFHYLVRRWPSAKSGS